MTYKDKKTGIAQKKLSMPEKKIEIDILRGTMVLNSP